MKLHEIIDTQHSNEYAKGSEINSGLFSTVYDDDSDPHMVVKLNNFSHDIAFDAYIAAIVKNKLTGVNPYVPRVYKRNDKIYQIEKLVSPRVLTSEDMSAVADKMGVYVNQDDDAHQKYYHIIIYIKNRINYDQEVKSKKLKEVIDLIKNLISEHGFVNDVGGENIMFRRTPHGYQLVFSDPIAKL